MITVLNKKTAMWRSRADRINVHIDRPNLFGNPYRLTRSQSENEDMRKQAIENFDKYMRTRFWAEPKNDEDRRFIALLKKLADIHKHDKKKIYLLCWCKPLSCHGDKIKEFVEELAAL